MKPIRSLRQSMSDGLMNPSEMAAALGGSPPDARIPRIISVAARKDLVCK